MLPKEARNNKRKFFRYVNSKLKVRPEISEMKNELGELVDNDKDIADILAKYFNYVYTPVNEEQMSELEDMYRTEIQSMEVTRQGVQAKLEKLNVLKSCGSDDTTPMFYKKLPVLSLYLFR